MQTIGINSILITDDLDQSLSLDNLAYFLIDKRIKIEFDIAYGESLVNQIRYVLWTRNSLAVREFVDPTGLSRSHIFSGDYGSLDYGEENGDVLFARIDIEDTNGIVNSFYAERFFPEEGTDITFASSNAKQGFSTIEISQRQDGSEIVDIDYGYSGRFEISASNVSAYYYNNGWNYISTSHMRGDVGVGTMPGRNRAVWKPKLTLSASNTYPSSINVKLTLKDIDGYSNYGMESGVAVLNLYKPEVAIRRISLEEEYLEIESSSSSSIDSSSSSSSSTSSSSSSSMEYSSSSSSSSVEYSSSSSSSSMEYSSSSSSSSVEYSSSSSSVEYSSSSSSSVEYSSSSSMEYSSSSSMEYSSSSNSSSSSSYTAPLVGLETAWYKMNDNDNNSIVLDYSINNLNGTLYNNSNNYTSENSVSGKVGTALSFSTKGIDLGSSNLINFSAPPFSFALWVNIDSYNIYSSNLIGGFGQAGDAGNFGFVLNPSGHLAFTIYGIAGEVTGLDVVPVQVWHHIAMTYDSSNMITFYIDGVADSAGSQYFACYPNHGNLYLGALDIPPWGGWVLTYYGAEDDVRIYDFALNQTQIDTIYNGGSGSVGPLT